MPLDFVTTATKFEEEDDLSVRTGRRLTGADWIPKNDNPSEYCPDKVECKKLGASCILCDFNYRCLYGKEYNTTCRPKNGVFCTVSLLKSWIIKAKK